MARKALKKAAKKSPPPRKPVSVKRKPGRRAVGRTSARKVRTPAKHALAAEIPGASRVLFTANGAALLVVREDKKTLTLWDLATGTETPPFKTLPTVSAVALSADNRLIAMGTHTGILAVDSAQAGKVDWKTKASGQAIGQVLFTLDGALVITAPRYEEEGDAWFHVYHAATGAEEKAFEPVAGARVCHLALSSDGLFLAHSEMRSHSVLVWHLPTRQMGACIRLNPQNGAIVGLAFGHSVKELFVGQENRLTAWNGENGLLHAEMAVQGVRSLAVIAGGKTLVSLRRGSGAGAGGGPALNLWNAESGRLRKTIDLPAGDYGTLSVPPSGAQVALPGEKVCWVWNAEKLME
jgi:WD40 repeat protein